MRSRRSTQSASNDNTLPFPTVVLEVANMFEKFYDLTATPFSRDIPVTELLATPEIEDVLGRMQHAARRQLFIVDAGL